MSSNATMKKLAKAQAIHDISEKRVDGSVTHEDYQKLNELQSPEKQHRERRYNASVYLDTSDPEQFYLIVAAGTVISAVFEFNPKTCTAIDRTQNRMLMAAARTLLKDKGSLTKLATYRLEKMDLQEGCKFHPDNFGAVFAALAMAFTVNMPKSEEAIA